MRVHEGSRITRPSRGSLCLWFRVDGRRTILCKNIWRPCLAVGRQRQFAGTVSPSDSPAPLVRARWRAALARFPQVAMSHQRRRPVRDVS